MEEDLIQKLEKIELADIETPTHREKLKIALINWKYFQEKRAWGFFPVLKKAGLILGGSIVLLLIILNINNFLIPQDNFARAQKIALGDPQVKGLIAEGGQIKDVEIVNSKAYVLISPQQPIEKPIEELSPGTGEIKRAEEKLTALTEINLKEKKVSKIEKIAPQMFPLNEEEKRKAREIARQSPEVLGLIPNEAELISIETITSTQFRLIKEGNQVTLEPEEKKALIIYKLGENRWSKKVNITKEEVEEIEILEREN